jgi:tetratricopeptide (TPR) repeat protein
LRGTRRLAEALAFQGDPDAGRELAEAALLRARVLELERVESGLIVALTVCTDALGDRVAGLELSLQDLALNRRSGNRVNEAVALSNLGMSYLAFGAFSEARGYLEDALRMHRRLGNREIEGNTCSVLSELAWREGDAALALEHAQTACGIATEGGNRLYQTDALWSLGNAKLALGRLNEADDAFESSGALASEIGWVPQSLNALDGRARVAVARADTAQAGRLIERLLQQAATAVPQGDTGVMSGRFHCGDNRDDHNPFAGAYEHLIRLTMFRVWSSIGDNRAGPSLTEAYARLMAEADRIRDADLRQRFLMHIAEHREIRAAAFDAQLCGN